MSTDGMSGFLCSGRNHLLELLLFGSGTCQRLQSRRFGLLFEPLLLGRCPLLGLHETRAAGKQLTRVECSDRPRGETCYHVAEKDEVHIGTV
jgi:hypothetical protein